MCILQAQAEEDEFRRAQERLTLKHRNTSRWARRALKRGLSLATDDQRDAIHEQLRVGRELKAKAASARTSSDSDASCGTPPLALVSIVSLLLPTPCKPACGLPLGRGCAASDINTDCVAG